MQWITMSEDFFKKYISHFICNVCMWEGVGDRTKTAIYWPHSYGHQRWVFLVLLMLNWRPGGSAFCWVLAFYTTSCHQRVSKTTGGPKGPFGWVWLSLPHLVSNSSYLQLSDFLSWQSYIIVQHPLNLWNGMFDGHQAEITVMQFRGHSLLVHQSMSVSCTFTLSHFISQIHLCDFFRLLAIGMCYFLLVHHFGMACLAGSKVKIQHLIRMLLISIQWILWIILNSIYAFIWPFSYKQDVTKGQFFSRI